MRIHMYTDALGISNYHNGRPMHAVSEEGKQTKFDTHHVEVDETEVTTITNCGNYFSYVVQKKSD